MEYGKRKLVNFITSQFENRIQLEGDMSRISTRAPSIVERCRKSAPEKSKSVVDKVTSSKIGAGFIMLLPLLVFVGLGLLIRSLPAHQSCGSRLLSRQAEILHTELQRWLRNIWTKTDLTGIEIANEIEMLKEDSEWLTGLARESQGITHSWAQSLVSSQTRYDQSLVRLPESVKDQDIRRANFTASLDSAIGNMNAEVAQSIDNRHDCSSILGFIDLLLRVQRQPQI